MRLALPAACAAVLALEAAAQGLRTPDVVRLVLERQPQLSEDSLDLAKAREQVDLLERKVILPKLDVTVGFGPAPGFRYDYTYDTSRNGAGDIVSVRKTDSTRHYAWWPMGPTFGTDVEVAQPLNVGKLRAGMRAARAGARAAQAELEGHRQTEVRKALEYLFALEYANRMTALLLDANSRLDSVEQVLQGKLDSDEDGVSQTDLYQLQTGRFDLEKSLQEAKLGRERARTGLSFALAMPADSLRLDDSLLQPLPELPPLDTLDLHLHHPDLARLQAGLEAKQALVEVERMGLGPDIFIFGKFSYTKAWVANRNQQNQDVLITDPLNDISGMVGLGFKWHLNFWNQLGNVRSAELDWQQLRRKEAYARIGLSSLLKDAWLRYSTLGERIESARKGRTAADAWLRTVGQQVDLDPSRAKDLVGPYKTWLEFQNKYWEAVYQRNLAALEVLEGSGTLLTWPGFVGPDSP
jgi:outer membrane protein TolC